MLVDVDALQRENAAQRAENAVQRAQIAELISSNTMLLGEIAKLNERVAELLAIAQRKQRKTATPSEKKPEPPPAIGADAQQAFDARPTAPVLPEKTNTPKSPKRTGRNAIPQHLEVEEHRQPRPDQCEHCGGTRLGVADEVVEEKLHVVKEHQRRRRVARPTCRCADCGGRTTAPSLPAPYERSKVTCEWLAWFIHQKFGLLSPLDRIRRDLLDRSIPLAMGTLVSFVERAADLLAPFVGTLTADAEHRFNAVYATGRVIEAGCNAHGRRKFRDAEQTQPVLAKEGGAFIAAMYVAEEHARTNGMEGQALLAHRREHIRPIADEFEKWLAAVEPTLLPSDLLTTAVGYYRKHGAALFRFIDDPQVPIDNSPTEREFQNFAKLRHNMLFAGSTEGAHRACVLLGIVATCRAIGVPVQAYLAWAFERLGTHRDHFGLELHEITPAAFKAARG